MHMPLPTPSIKLDDKLVKTMSKISKKQAKKASNNIQILVDPLIVSLILGYFLIKMIDLIFNTLLPKLFL